MTTGLTTGWAAVAFFNQQAVVGGHALLSRGGGRTLAANACLRALFGTSRLPKGFPSWGIKLNRTLPLAYVLLGVGGAVG